MADFIDGKSLHSLKVMELKDWLQRRGIKTSGKRKAELIERYADTYTVSC